MVRPDVLIGLVLDEHVVSGHEDGVGHGGDGVPLAAPSSDGGEQATRIGVPRMGGCPGGLGEGATQPATALRGATALAHASAVRVAGADSRPWGKVVSAGEARHVGADLSDDGLGADELHSWYRP